MQPIKMIAKKFRGGGYNELMSKNTPNKSIDGTLAQRLYIWIAIAFILVFLGMYAQNLVPLTVANCAAMAVLLVACYDIGRHS